MKMSSDIPRARDILENLAKEILQWRIKDDAEIDYYAGEIYRALSFMTRAKPTRKAKPHAIAATEELCDAIRDYAHNHPSMGMAEIGIEFGVNQGRVSEALAHKR
jgi:hypothetical protein